MVGRAKDLSFNIESGIFAAEMKVTLVNDGHCNFSIEMLDICMNKSIKVYGIKNCDTVKRAIVLFK